MSESTPDECWLNVYEGGRVGAVPFYSKAEARRFAGSGVVYRLHVKLKPPPVPATILAAVQSIMVPGEFWKWMNRERV